MKLNHRRTALEATAPHDDRGATIILFALLVTALLIIAAIVVDFGFARQVARNEQSSADSAALAGAQDLPQEPTDSDANIKFKASRDAALNVLANSLSDNGSYSGAGSCGETEQVCVRTLNNAIVEIETPYDLYGTDSDDDHPDPHQLIRVKVCRPSPRFLGGVASGSGDYTVCREAVARAKTGYSAAGAGLVSLEEHACEAAKFQGSSEVDLIIYGGGSVLVNSDCETNALDGGGSAWEVRASSIEVVGGFNINPCTAEDCTPGTEPTRGHEPVEDPFAGIPEPARPTTNGTCTAGTDINPDTGTGTIGVTICTPGYYGGNFSFTNGEIRYLPGVYWIEGDLKLTGGRHKMLGILDAEPGEDDGVMFYLDSGELDMSGNAILDLPPPIAPSIYEGLSIYMSKLNTSCGTTGTSCKVNGTSGSSIGSIYMPNGHLELMGNMSPSDGPFVTGTVASNTFLVTGNGLVTIDSHEAPKAPRKPDIGLEK